MGFFDWLWGAKAQAVQEEEVPKRSPEEEALAKKYAASFTKPKNAGTTELVTMFNQCKEDLRYVRDPELITAINYYAVECLDAYIAHLIGVSELAFKRRNFYLMFEVLKKGLSIINLTGLTLPEVEEKITPILAMIASTEIPEEIKLFKYIQEGNDFDVVIEQDINTDAIENIINFCKKYKEIRELMSANTIMFTFKSEKLSLEELDVRASQIRQIFGNYLYRQSNLFNFIEKAEKSLEFMKISAGSTLEIFRDDYLCHVAYGSGPEGVRSILNTRLFFEGINGLWFFINKVHSGGTTNPTFILCLADVLQEAKERGLNFAIVPAEGSGEFKFIPRHNLFYDRIQSLYVTSREIKDILKTKPYAAVIYSDPALKDKRLRSPGVCVLDKPLNFYATYRGKPAASLKPKYAVYVIQKVDKGNEDPSRQMFRNIYDTSLYLMNTNEGKQILKSMLPRR